MNGWYWVFLVQRWNSLRFGKQAYEFNKPGIMYESLCEKETMQNLCYEIVEDLIPIARELKILFFCSTLYFLNTNIFSHQNFAAGLQFQL